MKKSELKSGMIVKKINGEIGMVMLNAPFGDIIVGNGENDRQQFWCPLESYSEDLKRIGGDNEDHIYQVLDFRSNKYGADLSVNGRKILWTRGVEDTVIKNITSQYDAKIDYDKKVVKVHDQVISFRKIIELYDLTLIEEPIAEAVSFKVQEQYQFDALMAVAQNVPDLKICETYKEEGWTTWPHFVLRNSGTNNTEHVLGSVSSFDETLSFEEMLKAVAEYKPIQSKVEITPVYTAKIKRGEKIVTVGCQDISFENVKKLRDAILK